MCKEDEAMNPTLHYRQTEQRCIYRPQGVATAGELAHMIGDVLAHAIQGGLREALVDITEMGGFESPGPAFRRWAVGLWADAARGLMRVAIVAREEHVCPNKTGLLAAAEEGLNANIFVDEWLAVAWLDSPPSAQ